MIISGNIMRILMITDFYKPIIGGLEQHVYNLSIELVRRGHKVTVITLWHDGLDEEEYDEGVEVYRIRGTVQRASGLFSNSGRRFSPPLPDPEAILAIRRVVDRLQPDVIHAHNWLVYSFLPLKRWSHAPLVMTLHDYGLACPKKTLMRDGTICDGPALAKCLKCATQHYGIAKGPPTVLSNTAMSGLLRASIDMFIPVSQAVADGNFLSDGPTPYRIIPNFVPDTIDVNEGDLVPELPQLPNENYLLFIGVVGHHKGIDVLLKAYTGIPSAPPLVLIGPHDSDAPTCFPPGVHVMGKWPHHAVMQARQRAILSLVPSIWADPCPTVVMEAMVSKQPVIASRIGGMPDLVIDGETGLLVPPGDVEALQQAITILIADSDMRVRMGQAASRHIVNYQASTVVTQIERLYQEIQQQPKSASIMA